MLLCSSLFVIHPLVPYFAEVLRWADKMTKHDAWLGSNKMQDFLISATMLIVLTTRLQMNDQARPTLHEKTPRQTRGIIQLSRTDRKWGKKTPPNYSDHRTREGKKTENLKRTQMKLFSSPSEKLFCCFCPFKEHKLKASLPRPLPDIAIKEMDYKSTENASPGGSVKVLVMGNRNWKAKTARAEFIFSRARAFCLFSPSSPWVEAMKFTDITGPVAFYFKYAVRNTWKQSSVLSNWLIKLNILSNYSHCSFRKSSIHHLKAGQIVNYYHTNLCNASRTYCSAGRNKDLDPKWKF